MPGVPVCSLYANGLVMGLAMSTRFVFGHD